jgi:predicted nuclease of predicted toxin-antitoxin system
MRVLLDSCLSSVLVEPISSAGHQVSWVGDWPAGDPGDAKVLDEAIAQGSVLITLDRDFGELAVLRGTKHAGIIRIVDVRVKDQAARWIEVLSAHGPALLAGAIVTAEPTRTRVRPAE